MQAIWVIFRARSREFWRDRGSLIWNLALPLVLVLGLSAIFGGQGQPSYRVLWLGAEDAYLNPPQLMSLKAVASQRVWDQDAALHALAYHQVDLVLDLDRRHYWINEYSDKGQVLQALLAATDAHYVRHALATLPVRYLDWLLPGVLAMNLMYASLFGVGYALVRYRRNGVLKRLAATPLTQGQFILGQVLARLWVVLLVNALIFVGLRLTLGVSQQGPWWLLLLVMLLGSLTMISLGLLVAARVQSEELGSGLLNIMTWPMLMLSGVFFSLQMAPLWLQSLASVLPLTQIVVAMRLVMVEGAGWSQLWPSLVWLSGQGVVFMTLALTLFRWHGRGRV